jgi:hypothetical protein
VPATTPTQQPPIIVQQPQQGILSQIATTAAGVAVGHTVGRMVTSLFSGGSGGGAPLVEGGQGTAAVSERCAPDVQQFVECMSKHHEDMASCQHFYEVMRQCAQSQ